jgi:hypothetical protein
MSQPHQKIPELCRLLGGLYIGHAIRPSTCAEDVEVTPRLELASKCTVMCFFGVSRESYPNCKVFFGRGTRCIFLALFSIEN